MLANSTDSVAAYPGNGLLSKGRPDLPAVGREDSDVRRVGADLAHVGYGLVFPDDDAGRSLLPDVRWLL